ncbi:MAG: hypothetical protein HN929_01035, partial [Chloroflexi bacterium]|nr:hypothetical protein [Chloroflexota bacterium]
ALTTNAAGDYALRTQTEGAQTMSSLTMTGDIDNGGNYLLNDQTTTNMMSKGTVYRFDGVDDVITFATPFAIGDGDFAVFADVYTTDLSGTQHIIIGGNHSFNLSIRPTTGFLRATKTSAIDLTASTGAVSANTWVSIGYVKSGAVGTYYINGLPAGTTTDVQDYSATCTTLGVTTASPEAFAEFAYSNFAPTAAEVKDLISGNIPFKWQYGSQTDLLSGWDFTSSWTTAGSYTVTDADTFTGTGGGGLQLASIFDITGKEYRMRIAGTASASILKLADAGTGTQITGTPDMVGTFDETFTFNTSGMVSGSAYLRMDASATVDITTLEVRQLGAVALYTQDSITANNWFDLANGNTGAVTGAEVLNPKGISTDEDNIPNFSVTSGITADTGSAQGNGVLTASINQISVCGNAGDAVTLPAAKPGKVLWVFNDGANASDVFPASGDNIDEAGANAALSVAVNAEVQFVCTSAGHWSTITSA